jgi:hypothetical protein
MPDNLLPPSWGPAPFDERDLDAVLSGEMTDIPVALRPVADTLAALRAAGAPAEFSGEAAIMAEFRGLAESHGLGEAARPADPAATLQLPAAPADRPRSGRRAARQRGKRRAAPRVSLRAGALTGLAAAAVIAVAVVFTGLPGPIQRLVDRAHQSTVSPSHPGGGDSASPGLQAKGATAEPTPTPAHSRHGAASPSSEPSRLCREYYGYSTPPGSADRRAESSLIKQLSKLAGGSHRIPGYCSPYVGDLSPNGGQGNGGHHPGTHPGNGGQGNQAQASEPAQPGQGGNQGSGNGGSGTG